MEAEAEVEGGGASATRQSLKHTALLQVEATLYIHNGSNDMVISMLYNISLCKLKYVKYHVCYMIYILLYIFSLL